MSVLLLQFSMRMLWGPDLGEVAGSSRCFKSSKRYKALQNKMPTGFILSELLQLPLITTNPCNGQNITLPFGKTETGAERQALMPGATNGKELLSPAS